MTAKKSNAVNPGWVYVLSNPHFPGWLKIGTTDVNVLARVGHQSAHTLHDHKCELVVEAADAGDAKHLENILHHEFKQCRVDVLRNDITKTKKDLFFVSVATVKEAIEKQKKLLSAIGLKVKLIDPKILRAPTAKRKLVVEENLITEDKRNALRYRSDDLLKGMSFTQRGVTVKILGGGDYECKWDKGSHTVNGSLNSAFKETLQKMGAKHPSSYPWKLAKHDGKSVDDWLQIKADEKRN